MKYRLNFVLYLIAFCLFILLKIWFKFATTHQLYLLLKPTNQIVEFLTGSASVYSKEVGFYHETLHVIIDKSCSGFNFMILSFIVFIHLGINHFKKSIHKTICIPLAFIGSYFLTLFVNSSRIYVSIVVQNQTQNISSIDQSILHEAIGIITNLSFLVLVYLLIEKALNRKKSYEKLTQS